MFAVLKTGTIYSLLGLAMLLVFMSARLMDMAVGAYGMIAGLGAAWFASHLGLPIGAAIVLGLALGIVAGVVAEQFVVRPLQRRTDAEVPILMALVALLFAISQVGGIVFGRTPLTAPAIVEGEPINLLGGVIQPNVVLVAGITVLVFVGVWLLVKRSRYGRLLRAIGDNIAAAQVLGFEIRRVRLATAATAGVVAGLAGVFAGSLNGLSFASALPYTFFAFIAMVVGGTGSVWGPLLGGFLLSAVQVYSAFHLGGEYLDYSTMAMALLVFTFRPQGLISHHVRFEFGE